MTKKIFILIFSLLVIGLFSNSCETPTTNTPDNTSDKKELKVGDSVSDSFIEMFQPEYKQGMKWVYINKAKDNSVESIESSVEVEIVDDTSITLLLTNNGKTTRQTINKENLNPYKGKNFVYEGKEELTVPAGTYKDVTKVSFTENGIKTTIWLKEEIEALKTEDNLVISELKEFSK